MPKKIILDVDDNVWKKVRILKVEKDFKNMNEASVFLIKKGLEAEV